MSERKPRIDFEGRTRLETVIPLSTPYLVFLDPSDLCNAKCPHCPTGSGEALRYKKPQIMDFDLYKKIIDDLCELPEPVKTLRLYKDGEPLLNPKFPEMVRYAKETGRFGQIDTTSNGKLLDKHMAYRLVEAGLDKIFISVPSDYDNGYLLDMAEFFRGTYYYEGTSGGKIKVYVKTIGDNMSEDDKKRFYDDFGPISDRIFIENLAPCWPEFNVGQVGTRGIYDQPLTPAPKVCPYLFYSLAINSDGTVSLCFLDWQHGMILGDLKEMQFADIWNGERLRTVQRTHLQGNRAFYSACRNCQQLVYGAPDNVDEYAEELLRRIAREHLKFDWPTAG